MKRILTITALLLIFVLALTACGGKDKKEETVYDILADSFEKTFNSQKDESTAIWEQALQSGSIEEVISMDSTYAVQTISEKSYFGKDSFASIFSIALKSGEKFDLSMFTDEKDLSILSSAFTGAYGLTHEGLTDFINQYVLSAQGVSNTSVVSAQQALTKAIEKHEKEFQDLFESRFPIMMNEAESSLNFSFIISNTNVKQFLNDILTVIEKDDNFKKALVDYAIAIGEPMTSAELDKELADSKKELNELDEEPFDATVSITASKDRVINSASLTVYEGGKNQAGTLATKKQIARVLISLPTSGGFNIEATVEDQTITAAYTITEFGTVTKETLSIGAMGVSLTPLSLTYDSANGDYELKVEIPGTFSATAKGKYTATKTEATLTVSSIKMTISPGYDVSIPENPFAGLTGTTIDFPLTLTITAKTSDTAPKAPTSYTDISKLSEEELSALVSKIENDPAVYNLIKTINAHFER